MDAHSVDDVLVKAMSDKPEQPPVPEVSSPKPPEVPPEKAESPPADEYLSSEETPDNSSDVLRGTSPDKKGEDSPSKKTAESSPIDEYGNPTAKPRTYTEEEHRNEVERIVRERLARVRQPEQPQPTRQEAKKASEDFQPDPNSEESWEVQLESFIEKTIDKRQSRYAEQEWRQQEAQRQAEFESKFNAGMGKYQDFHQAVSGKPFTNEMMLAMRALPDPAAFAYATSKIHLPELERISRIKDPYAVSAEIGRLHERMVREKKAVSQAARPLEAAKGDMPSGVPRQPSIEERIHQYATTQKRR